MNPLQKWLGWLAFCGALLGGGCIGWVVGDITGRTEGRKLERADKDAQTVKDLTGLIDSHQGLITQANTASQKMRAALNLRAMHDAQTSKEFKDALLATADSRAGCVFSADIMRGLEGARARAAQAAAGGIQGTLPGPATHGGRP